MLLGIGIAVQVLSAFVVYSIIIYSDIFFDNMCQFMFQMFILLLLTLTEFSISRDFEIERAFMSYFVPDCSDNIHWGLLLDFWVIILKNSKELGLFFNLRSIYEVFFLLIFAFLAKMTLFLLGKSSFSGNWWAQIQIGFLFGLLILI